MTPTNTRTPTPTTTATRTPTQTPTQSPFVACPTSITETNADLPTFNGTYEYYGIGYLNTDDDIVFGTLLGTSYIIYKEVGVSNYIIYTEDSVSTKWRNFNTSDNDPLQNQTITSGGVSYPQAGTTSSGAYLAYPSICETTSTPTATPTNTPTPSSTSAGVVLWNTNTTQWNNENRLWNTI